MTTTTRRLAEVTIRQSTARSGRQPFVELCLRRLPTGRILNVGSGFTGATSSPAQQLFNVDLDPRVLAPGASRSAACDAAHLPFCSGTFDDAILKDILEHVPDPVGVLAELARVARPDAKIIVTVPRAIPRAVWPDPTHVRGFTRRSVGWALGGWEVDGRDDRVGSIPGAGHVPFLLEHSHQILRLPGLGHFFGLNWMATARLRRPRGR